MSQKEKKKMLKAKKNLAKQKNSASVTLNLFLKKVEPWHNNNYYLLGVCRQPTDLLKSIRSNSTCWVGLNFKN